MRHFFTIIVLIVLFLFSWTANAQTMRFDARQYVSEEGDTLNYRISTPDASGSQTYPVVLFLHGAGERGSDNLSQLKWGVQNLATDEAMMRYKPIVIAPQAPTDGWWSNFDGDFRKGQTLRLGEEPARALELTMELLDQVIANAPADSSRIYITGLSMGGFGTWDALARWPEKFAAAVPVCGGGAPATVERMADIPIWAVHGADDPVVPPELSRQMVEALWEAGANPGYTEYPQVGHFSWVQAYRDPVLLSWMFSQRKE